MRIAVLGPLEVTNDDGRPVAVPGGKERLLLAVLAAAAPGVVSTDRILDSLWNGDRPATARKSLQVHLVHLRSALEPDRPHGSTGRYVVRRGRRLRTRGRARGRRRPADRRPRRPRPGPPGRRRSGRGGEAARHRPRPLAGRALRRLAGRRRSPTRSGAGSPRSAPARSPRCSRPGSRWASTPTWSRRLERLLVEDPLQEEWWRLLVLALYRGGRQGDALAAVARARAVLVEELGAEPGPRLRAVEAAVLAQDPALDLPPVAERRAPPSDVSACPYKGLATYQAADAGLFHGRSRVVTRPGGTAGRRAADRGVGLERRRASPRWSGPASCPLWRRARCPGSAAWRAVVLTPGRRPVDALAALTGAAPPDIRPVLLVCRPARGALGARRRRRRSGPRSSTQSSGLLDDGHRRAVRRRRCGGTTWGGWPSTPPSPSGSAAALVLVPALTEDELREVVRGPAAAVGLTRGDRAPRRRRRRRGRPACRAAAAVDGAGRHVGAPPRGPAHPRRIPGGGRGRRRARPVGGGRLRGARRRGPGVRAPTPRAAGRHRRRRCARPQAAAPGRARPAGAGAPAPVVDAFVARRLLAVDGDRPRRRARGTPDLVAATGPLAGGRRGRPGGAATPRPGRPGVAAARRTGRRAVPRRTPLRRPRLGRRRRSTTSPPWSGGSSTPPRRAPMPSSARPATVCAREAVARRRHAPAGGGAGRRARRRARRRRPGGARATRGRAGDRRRVRPRSPMRTGSRPCPAPRSRWI